MKKNKKINKKFVVPQPHVCLISAFTFCLTGKRHSILIYQKKKKNNNHAHSHSFKLSAVSTPLKKKKKKKEEEEEEGAERLEVASGQANELLATRGNCRAFKEWFL
jgi:hypothetical protein